MSFLRSENMMNGIANLHCEVIQAKLGVSWHGRSRIARLMMQSSERKLRANTKLLVRSQKCVPNCTQRPATAHCDVRDKRGKL